MTADVLNHLWQSTIVAAVAALLSLAFRHNRARLRYGLWFAASIKFLVPLAALAAVGSLLEWRQAPAPIAAAVTSPAIRGFNAPFGEVSDPIVAVVVAQKNDWVALVLVGAWLCGFAAIALRRAQEWRRIYAAVRTSTPWNAPAHMPAGIRIRTAPTLLEPGVVGLWNAVILLPVGIDTYLAERQFAAVLAHEVCHARRRDNLTAAVHMVVEALFWFHPMVWWIGARLVRERERACDEHVVATLGEPIAYAEGIVTVCRRYVEAPLMSVAGVGGGGVKARLDAILANRIALRLTLPKRLLLATVALVSLAVPIATGAIDAAALSAAQAQAPAAPRFEAVSIKRSSGGPGQAGPVPGGYRAINVPIFIVLGEAYSTRFSDQIVGAPDWFYEEPYDLIARYEGTPTAAERQAMWRGVFAERFKLKARMEQRPRDIYAMVLAREGRVSTNLKKSDIDCSASAAAADCTRFNPRGVLTTEGSSMAMLARTVAPVTGRTVVDRTGLSGSYAFTLTFSPRRADATTPDPPDGPPSIFTAVQEQLGLKLEPTKDPVDVLVIEHIERPSQN